jgi:AcrR family transcriptional regulator
MNNPWLPSESQCVLVSEVFSGDRPFIPQGDRHGFRVADRHGISKGQMALTGAGGRVKTLEESALTYLLVFLILPGMTRRPGTDFRRRRAARTRRQILDAGLRVFSRSGYDRASMDAIALELEATKGLLYHYFRSKQELLKAILQEHPLRMGIETLERGVSEPGLSRAPAETDGSGQALQPALSNVVLLSLREMREHRAFIRFLLLQSHYSPDQADLVRRELLDRWAAVFESIIKRHLPEGSPGARSLASQLIDILVASFVRSELGGRPRGADLEAYVLDAVETVASRVESEVRSRRSQ